MSEIRSTASPSGEPNPDDPTTDALAPGEAESLAALNGHAEPTDDTPTIISRTMPRSGPEQTASGLRGRKLAHFELIEPIGVGGMAAVIRARDTQLDRLVALKILPPEMAIEEENVRRFHQEARSAARLDHENVARVFFCGEDQRLHFIAFEFVEGDNLRTILERRGRLPVAEALHYILQVAAGVAHAAQRGVVHRDIKPSNIIITPTGRAKLVDMGLARSMERQDDKGLTQSGVTLGTFDYISPEQALEPREADVRSDIYSLGCTLYHVLTGCPPVPEGTAAKKLHHHQHIKPRDPRELVPGLPDEVAVILGRMMAKKPQDRYQSPEQLVHHLLLAARKLGGPSNVPEGVLSVEAALPPPPGGRPLLMAGLAVALVVLLIVVMEVFNRTPGAAPSFAGPALVNNGPEAAKSDQPKPSDLGPPPGPTKDKQSDKGTLPPDPPEVAVPVVYDDASPAAPSLAEWLSRVPLEAEKTILLSRDLDLSTKEGVEPGLIVTGPRVSIRAKSPDRRPTIHFTYDGRTQEGPNAWTAVRIDSPDVSVQGVRFLVDGTAAKVSMVGLGLHGTGPLSNSFTVDNCEFIQARAVKGDNRLTSLEAAEGDATRASLTLTRCRFLSFQGLEKEGDNETLVDGQFGGDDAVRRDGAVKIKATDCAFGPHGALFRLEGGKGSVAPTLSLDHCSVLAAGASTVFDVRTGAAVDINVHASLFSRPDETGADASPKGAVLIHQVDSDGVTYSDRENCYHGLDAYWVVGDGYARAGWAEFQTKALIGKTTTLLDGASSPWKNDLQPFRKYNPKEDRAEGHFVSAFQINEARADLRLTGGKSPVGVHALGGVDYVALLAEADKQAEVASKKRRIVDPTMNDSANRVYGKLEEALSACENGDEVVLRYDGLLPVEPIRLEKKNLQDVTIRPDENHHPVLRLVAARDRDPEPALFRVYDGKLKLEGLEFILQPDDKFGRQSLIDLAGQGQCILTNCVVTMERANQPNTRLAVATLSDPGKVMMQPARPLDQSPRLILDGCFIRGDGDLIVCQISRPIALVAENTLVALKGSLLNVEVGAVGPDAVAAPPGQMSLTLKKVTTYLTGNLVRLRSGKDYRSLTPVRVAPTDCLFVAAAREPQPLIHLDDSDLEEKALGKVLFWDGGRTYYGNYGTMLDQSPPGEEMTRPDIGSVRWEILWGNSTGKPLKPFHFGVPTPPLPDDPFGAAVPLQFRTLDAVDNCGADVNRLDQTLPPLGPSTPK